MRIKIISIFSSRMTCLEVLFLSVFSTQFRSINALWSCSAMRRLYIVKCCGTKGCMPTKSRSPTWSNRNSSVIGSAGSSINSTTFVEGQDSADKNQSIYFQNILQSKKFKKSRFFCSYIVTFNIYSC
jgi:hypothetical protein